MFPIGVYTAMFAQYYPPINQDCQREEGPSAHGQHTSVSPVSIGARIQTESGAIYHETGSLREFKHQPIDQA